MSEDAIVLSFSSRTNYYTHTHKQCCAQHSCAHRLALTLSPLALCSLCSFALGQPKRRAQPPHTKPNTCTAFVVVVAFTVLICRTVTTARGECERVRVMRESKVMSESACACEMRQSASMCVRVFACLCL